MSSPPASSVRPRLFVLGDSISMHYGPYLEKSLGPRWGYERKQGRSDPIDQGTGANGGDSNAVLAYLQQRRDTGGIAADWLLLNCGLHDVRRDPATGARRVDSDRYEANLVSILAVIRELRLRPIWVRITPVVEALHNVLPRRKDYDRFNADIDAYNASADRIMMTAGVPMIDLAAFTATLLPDATYDGVHFNDDVKQRQGAFLAGALEALATAERLALRP